MASALFRQRDVAHRGSIAETGSNQARFAGGDPLMSQRVMRFNFGLATAAVLALVGTTAGQYSDTKFCVVCHESPELKRDFCDAVPASVWRQDDKHRRAFELLHEAN